MIDTHCHILHDTMNSRLNEVEEKCQKYGVEKILNICLSESEFKEARNIKLTKVKMKLAYGMHPADIKSNVEKEQNILDEIRLAGENKEIVAVGEIGLDYHWIKEDIWKKKQAENFIKQIELAQDLQLPIIIHARDALDETYDILRRFAPIKGVMHSFSGSAVEAKKFIDLGMYIGISGIVTFKSNEKTRDVVKNVDLKNLLVETDSPYLTPEPFRGTKNEPAYVYYVMEKIAQVKNVKKEEVEAIINNNSENVFGAF